MRAPLVIATASLAAALGAPPAAAAELRTVGGGEVVEARYQLDIHVRGLVAEVEARQTLLDPGAKDVEALYTFDLPADAVITGLTIIPAGGAAVRGQVVSAEAAIALAPDRDVVAMAPDLGLLRLVARGDAAAPATYELRVFPVPAGKTVVASVRWLMPLAVDNGRLALRLPGRGTAANLTRETGTIRLSPAPGLRGYRDVRADGARLAAQAGAAPLRFATSRSGGLKIDAAVDVAGGGPVAWFDLLPIDATQGVLALSAASPLVGRADPVGDQQILIVADVSRSVGRDLRDAAARAVDAVLAAAPPNARVEGILFDRTARRVFSAWRRDARVDLVAAIRGADGGNGTDLGAAIDQAGLALAGGTPGAPTLVVIVTDGMLPVTLDADDLRRRLAAPVRQVDVGAVVIVPDQAAMPDLRGSPLHELAGAYGGRVLALRTSEMEARAPTLAGQLHEPEPLAGLDVELDGAAPIMTDLPATLEPGGGFVALGLYRGRKPTAVRLIGRGRGRVAVRARPGGAGAAALALRDRGDAASRPALRARGVLGAATSLVALGTGGAAARQRLALVAAGGPFTRIAPPPELAPDHAFRAVEAPPTSTAVRASAGDLPRDAVERMLNQQLVPRARECMQRLLATRTRIDGTLRLELELSRGEILAAAVSPRGLDHPVLTPCVLDAAYALNVPATALGDDPDPIYVVRYPLRFETRGDQVITVLGDADSAEPIDTGVHVDADDPLGTLPERRP